MRTPIFQIDAFTRHRFAGNPAAVMPMDVFPADTVLQAIAAENNLAETAFLVPAGDGYRLRWFTPTIEVPLCGHATLASAAVRNRCIAAGHMPYTDVAARGLLRQDFENFVRDATFAQRNDHDA